ncbi:MAG: hypothetical protein LAP38_00325 [Acidobacteriia bacterium]|nr:hypothetical protein [Terriglobia bacterium]
MRQVGENNLFTLSCYCGVHDTVDTDCDIAHHPDRGFGPLGEGHVRFALVENEHRIRQAAKSIQHFLKQ